MEVSGSEQSSGGSSMYITAEPMYFRESDGLSGDVIFSLFEDREGSVWVSTNGGLDRFRDLAVSTISVKQGLSSDAAWSILAARDGSVWVGSSRWFEQVEERTNYDDPQSKWTAG